MRLSHRDNITETIKETGEITKGETKIIEKTGPKTIMKKTLTIRTKDKSNINSQLMLKFLKFRSLLHQNQNLFLSLLSLNLNQPNSQLKKLRSS